MTALLDTDKLETQKQWDTDPCGAETVAGLPHGSLDYYRQIRRYRYETYGPWFEQAARFDEYRGKSILEIGVGLGSDHARFAQAGNQMTAIDLSREHLRETVRHLSLEGLSTRPIYGDAENLPFADNSFDVVYSFGVLMHTPDTARAFAEIRRVLRPGGVAIVAVYHRYSWFFVVQTLLVNGLIRGGLWRLGWRRLMSEVEYRSEANAAVPLVKVFSRRDLRSFCRGFRSVEFETCHVETSHFGYLAPLARRFSRETLERRLGFGGWYLFARAHK